MNKKTFAGLAMCCAMLSSCYCDKIAVGNVNTDEDLVHVRSVRNFHLIGGSVVTHEKASDYIGDIKDYVIETKRTFGDLLLSGITFGIYSPTTTKFYVPASNPRVVKENAKPQSKAYNGYLK